MLMDIHTIAQHPDIFEVVDAAVTAHFKAHVTEFSGSKMVVANFAADPLKFTLCVWWEYSHSGKGLPAEIAAAGLHAGAVVAPPCYSRGYRHACGVCAVRWLDTLALALLGTMLPSSALVEKQPL